MARQCLILFVVSTSTVISTNTSGYTRSRSTLCNFCVIWYFLNHQDAPAITKANRPSRINRTTTKGSRRRTILHYSIGKLENRLKRKNLLAIIFLIINASIRHVQYNVES
ncbi:hypothetical protein K501DRAFT_272769 [Backusella circina FSU 941]|nr:hypothetical protein K501DRAFT_272769 [Backusella circina FSU 941]